MSLQDDPRVGARRTWVADGLRVWAPVKIDASGRLVYSVCDVVCAAGNHARVRSVKPDEAGRHMDTWRDVTDLFDYVKVEH